MPVTDEAIDNFILRMLPIEIDVKAPKVPAAPKGFAPPPPTAGANESKRCSPVCRFETVVVFANATMPMSPLCVTAPRYSISP